MWVRSLGREYPWRRKYQPVPVFMPGKFHRQKSLVDYTVHAISKSQTWLSVHAHMHALIFWIFIHFELQVSWESLGRKNSEKLVLRLSLTGCHVTQGWAKEQDTAWGPCWEGAILCNRWGAERSLRPPGGPDMTTSKKAACLWCLDETKWKECWCWTTKLLCSFISFIQALLSSSCYWGTFDCQ